MGHVWYGHRHHRDSRKHEHPVTALLAVVAILLAIVLISLARVAVHGTRDLETTLIELSPGSLNGNGNPTAKEIEAAVVTSRWATGVTP
jgi:hypothetical protein